MAVQLERDLGWRRIQRELRLLDGSYTKVGLQEGDAHPEGKGTFSQVAAIGAVHEFGAPGANIPRRPFLSAAFEQNMGRLHTLKGKLLDSIYKGTRSARVALALLGQAHEDQVKAKIVDGPWVPLMVRTIQNRLRRSRRLNAVFGTSFRPLVDTGQMRQSVRHVEVLR